MGISDEYVINGLKELKKVTERNLIRKYGVEEGTRRFESYRQKQAYTNTLEYNIKKYGEEEGRKRYANIISSLKQILPNFIKRYGEEEGEKKYFEYIRKSNLGFHSKIASEMFENIENDLHLNDVTMYYAPKPKEFGKYDKLHEKYHMYDFVIPELKLCIEFNGDRWHGNPSLYSECDKPSPRNKNITAKEMWAADKIKNDNIINEGFDLIIVWESDYINNKPETVRNLINTIKEKYELFRNV